MKHPEYHIPQMFELIAMQDQLDLLTENSTAIDVASVWGSILTTWFPPIESYQLRLHSTTDWTEVYILRISRRPQHIKATTNLVFMMRCYGRSTEDIPPMGPWKPTYREIIDSISEFRQVTGAMGYLTYGAIACLGSVRLCEFNRDPPWMSACAEWPGLYGVHFSGPILKYLNRVKAEFAKGWGHPYTYYGKSGGRGVTGSIYAESEESETGETGETGDNMKNGQKSSKTGNGSSASPDEDGYLGDREKGAQTDDEAERKSEDSEIAGVTLD